MSVHARGTAPRVDGAPAKCPKAQCQQVVPEKAGLMVIKFPATVTAREARSFRRKIGSCLASDRPCVVADFSSVHEMDSAALTILTSCMREIANRDGSLQLAGISPEAATLFELARMDQVFDMLQAASESVRGYQAEVCQ